MFLQQTSHVEGCIQLLGQLQNLDLESILNIQQNSLVASSFFTLFLISPDEIDGQTFSSETTSTAHSVEVGISLSWEVYIIEGIP
jgi:hypothetical protein